MSRLPVGAEDIARARDNGMRPEDPVIVSLCGWHQGLANPQVLVTRPDHAWAFMAGLDATVYVQRGCRFVQSTLRGLAEPCERIGVWDVLLEQGVDVWPIWKRSDGTECHYAELRFRKGARFSRWGVFHWGPVIDAIYKRGVQ